MTHGVLDAVGVTPLLGRWFSEADDMPGSPGTVMLTYGYWHGFAVGLGMYAIRSTRAGTEALLAEAQRAIWSLNGRQPVFLVTTLKAL